MFWVCGRWPWCYDCCMSYLFYLTTRRATSIGSIYTLSPFLPHPARSLTVREDRPRLRRARRADTNILAVKFNTLTGPSAVHTGDAVVCSNPSCTAILSHFSSLSATSRDDDTPRVSGSHSIQWNLRTRDTLGLIVWSLVERLSVPLYNSSRH